MQTKVITEEALENPTVQNAYSTLMGNIYLMEKNKRFKTITITSCNTDNQNFAISRSLAISMAGMNNKTLLVDLDLRKKTIKSRVTQSTLSQSNQYGIVQYLKGNIDLNDVICKTNIDNLFFIDSGKVNYDPVSVICSGKLHEFLKWAETEYDYIVFNTSALELFSDALIISNLTEATILLAKVGYTKLTNLKKAQEQLKRVNSNLIGVILNKPCRGIFKRRIAPLNYYYKKSISGNVLSQ